MEIELLIDKIRKFPNCKVHSPSGFPVLEKGHHLPNDLFDFYNQCGGIDLFTDRDYGITIVSPKEFVLANPVIIGEKAEYDISSNWYIIGQDGNNDYITIDLDKFRLGRCYDSNWEIHGVAGSCPVIANSFTELLERLVLNNGDYWYWLQDDFTSLGDAYDE
ncbi:SMI1/KNR4 family protein [Neobacillus sp. YIM B06451]|uniref:SMI1/KNR4 family protein n=1 Tax=Neobacillus sp. YIM B06451 TaxID=3070994 RepID=UPI00292F5F8D|nr:SMI1/KNR4 family protein [Neobacillus sp. YIM B06451]